MFEPCIEAYTQVKENWGDAILSVITQTELTPMTCDEFLSHCTACGGNWGGMLLTGVKELYPEVWDAIPDNMGINAWNTICALLILLGVDLGEEKK